MATDDGRVTNPEAAQRARQPNSLPTTTKDGERGPGRSEEGARVREGRTMVSDGGQVINPEATQRARQPNSLAATTQDR
jgi:hypothetical protein